MRPTPQPARVRSAGEPQPRRSASRGAKVASLGLFLLVIGAGMPYYVLPVAGRVRSPLHAWFRPTGYVGQTAGILTFALLLFLWLYPLRKKHPRLAFTGSLVAWLNVHIVAGLAVPILGAIHAGWRFQGLIGLGYGAMLLVSLSGILGRYIYVRIPRSTSGIELTLTEMEARRDALERRIAETTVLDPAVVASALRPAADARRGGFASIIAGMLFSDFVRWKAVRALGRQWGPGLDRAALREAVRLARRQIALAQQVRMFDATRRVFRFWHVAHRPIAITGLIAVLIHVTAAVYLGVTWFW